MAPEAIQYLPIDAIECDPQVRSPINENSVVGLARSIQEIGLQQPIRIRRDQNRLIVVDGERRLRAAHLAKLITIAAIIEEKELCPAEVVQRQLIPNLQRCDLLPCERARGIRDLIEKTGWTEAEAAAKCGLSSATVTRLIALLSLPETIAKQVDSGAIAVSTAYELSRVRDPNKQIELAREAAAGKLTRDAASGQVKQARNGPPKQAAKSVSRAVVVLGGGRSISVSGEGLTLETLIAWIEELLAKARKARTQGWELATFTRAVKDECKD